MRNIRLIALAAVMAVVVVVLLTSSKETAKGSGTGGQLALGTPSLASGQIVLPVASGAATSPYSGFNAHVTFDASKLSYANVASGGVLETTGATTFCVGVATDSGAGGTGACNINGTQQTASGGTLANITLDRDVTVGCTAIHLVRFGPPDNGNSSTGSYTINSADSTVQSNTYGVTDLLVNLADGQAVTDPTDTDVDGQPNACDLDDDNDGWLDTSEAIIGTDPLLRCGTNANPADFNNDGFFDITDIGAAAGWFGSAAPPARYDIAPDPPDGSVDISDIGAVAGLFGQSCPP